MLLPSWINFSIFLGHAILVGHLLSWFFFLANLGRSFSKQQRTYFACYARSHHARGAPCSAPYMLWPLLCCVSPAGGMEFCTNPLETWQLIYPSEAVGAAAASKFPRSLQKAVTLFTSDKSRVCCDLPFFTSVKTPRRHLFGYTIVHPSTVITLG